ncbi:recombinase family protein [uncultured Brevundimonas sp.]|uniref:recombinase family protein n=1 Tax=uncultured Brevundimonas sp. TaxID=213418 RepID=UPI0030EBD5A0|tara:strand:+ start:16889 stop:17773 length:885 start_codon:yes stop_codon:yes gene_type:complete
MSKLAIGKGNAALWFGASASDSPEQFEAEARRYAESRGFRFGPMYGHVETGDQRTRQTELERLVNDARAGRVNLVITQRLDALAESATGLIALANQLHGMGAGIASLGDQIDTTELAARPFLPVAFALGRLKAEGDTATVQSLGRERQNRKTETPAPFGYRWRNSILEPHPYEAPVRSVLHVLFTEHKNPRTVARLLNERGYRLRSGVRFSATRVVSILTDPVGKGIYRGNHYRRRNRRATEQRAAETEAVEIEPVVAAELWNRCIMILNEQKALKAEEQNYPPKLVAERRSDS